MEIAERLVAENNARIRDAARVERSLEHDGELLDGPDTLPRPYEWVPGRPLAITTRGLSVGEPGDEAFVRRTLVLIAEADRGARRLAAGTSEESKAGPQRRLKGRCVGCGCPLDDSTSGCHNCHCRHSMRRAARNRPPSAVSSGETTSSCVP